LTRNDYSFIAENLGNWNSPEFLWWLGMLYGDGHVNNEKGKRSVTLTNEEPDLLDKWIALTGKGTPTLKSGSESCFDVEIGDIRLSSWLGDLGLSGKKSNKLPWLEEIPDELLHHFVRGLWDTDGSVLRKDRKNDKGRSPVLAVSISLTSPNFVKRMVSEINRIRGSEEHPVNYEFAPSTNPKHEDAGVAISTGRPGEALFRWIYGDAPEHLRSNRKYQSGYDFLAWAAANTSNCVKCGKEVRCRELCGGCVKLKWEDQLCACGKPVLAKGVCRTCYQRAWKASRSSWTKDQKTVKFLEQYPYSDYKDMSDIEKTKAESKLFSLYREKPFPWEIATELPDVAKSFDRVARGKITIEDTIIKSVSSVGQQLCLHAHPHRLEASYKNNKSIVASYSDDKYLQKAITHQLSYGDPVKPKAIVRALSAIVRAPLNFPPVMARWIVDTYCPDGGVVFDPCSGYGGRLLGTVSSHRGASYTGHDPEPRTEKGNARLARLLDCQDRVTTGRHAVEDAIDFPKSDLLMTSPPYYNRENYGEHASKLLKQYPTPDSWVEGFLSILLEKAAASSITVVINVAPLLIGRITVDLPEHVIRLGEKYGLAYKTTWSWELAAFGGKGRFESIIVMRKPGIT
jgi:hypothetical protein